MMTTSRGTGTAMKGRTMADKPNVTMRLVKGSKAVVTHPVTHYSAAAGGVATIIAAWLGLAPVGNVKADVAAVPPTIKTDTQAIVDAAAKPLELRLSAVEGKVDKLTSAIVGDPFIPNSGIVHRIAKIEEALTRVSVAPAAPK